MPHNRNLPNNAPRPDETESSPAHPSPPKTESNDFPLPKPSPYLLGNAPSEPISESAISGSANSASMHVPSPKELPSKDLPGQDDLPGQGEITIALQDISGGDTNAIGRLLPLVYFELRQVARSKLRNERPDHTLQATALVHEVIVKILGRSTPCTWENRRQFFRSAATVMRQILIDSARAKNRAKRAGTVQLTEDCAEQAVHELVDLDLILDLDSNLALLEKEDSQAAELVKLRLYAGLSVAEAAEVIGISRSKAYEDWMFARFWFTNHGKNLLNL